MPPSLSGTTFCLSCAHGRVEYFPPVLGYSPSVPTSLELYDEPHLFVSTVTDLVLDRHENPLYLGVCYQSTASRYRSLLRPHAGTFPFDKKNRNMVLCYDGYQSTLATRDERRKLKNGL